MSLIRACHVALVCVLATTAALAQIHIISSGDSELQEIGGGMVVMGGEEPDGSEAEPKKPAGPPTPRSKALEKLEYDRRASAILAAWSTPPKKPEEAKPEEPAKPAETPDEPAGEAVPAADAPPAVDPNAP